MPGKPKIPIEEWLKDHARRRRDAAGDAWELPSTIRSTLRAEVRRQFPARRPQPRLWNSIMGLLRTRFALPAGLAVALAVLAFAFWPESPTSRDFALNRSQPPSVEEKPQAEFRKEAVGTPPPPQEAAAGVAPTPPARLDDAGQEVAVDSSLEADRSPAPAPVAAAAASKTSGARIQPQTAPGSASAPTPVTRAAPLPPTENATAENASWRSTPEQANRRQFKQSVASSQATQDIERRVAFATILSAFELEQLGDRVRIVDLDGSIYAGKLSAPPETGLARRTRDRALKSEPAPTALSNSARENGTAAVEASPLFFQVSGTNRSLNQLVIFDGSLNSASNVVRIQGQVRIGADQKLTIDASEVPKP